MKKAEHFAKGPRVGAVLLARSDSSRLPGKSLLDLCGRPVLAHQMDRLKCASKPVEFVLATTTRSLDDGLCRVAESCGFKAFRGSVHDVVLRLRDAAAARGIDLLVVAGGDDVFCDPAFMDRLVEEYAGQPYDFITIEGVPFGTSPFGVTRSALDRLIDIRADDNTDGWERYFTDTGLFSCRSLHCDDPALAHPEIRLDLDYPEDLELIREIYKRLYKTGAVPPLKRVLRLLLEEEPELARINRAAHEKWLKNRAAAWPPIRLKPGVSANT